MKLSAKEKKAIERIEDAFYQDLGKGINKFQKITLYEDGITDIRKLLNIIEKQQKEIEKLKFNNHMLKKWNEQLDRNCISKDKIREKLKELEEQFKKYENEGLSGFVSKIDKGTKIEVLKELLEEDGEHIPRIE